MACAAIAALALCSLPCAGAFAQTYGYDASGRLTQVVYADFSSLGYSYDAGGNVLGVQRFAADRDGDGMPDAFEDANGLDKLDPDDAALDADGDGLTNLEEFQRGTGVQTADSDGDGVNDGDEVAAGRNPLANEGAAIEIITTILLDE